MLGRKILWWNHYAKEDKQSLKNADLRNPRNVKQSTGCTYPWRMQLNKNSWYRIVPMIPQKVQIPHLTIVAYVSVKTAVKPNSSHYSTNMKTALKLGFRYEVKENQCLHRLSSSVSGQTTLNLSNKRLNNPFTFSLFQISHYESTSFSLEMSLLTQ